MNWQPEQYLKFADERRRPALDLLARLDGTDPARIVDLGCGAGNITRLLAERWPQAQIVAVDNDAAMLAKASATPSAIAWQRAEVGSWQTGCAPELIFSNAALHWLDDHRQLLPALLGQLSEGGVLAVQMPANFNAPSHRLLRELASEPLWRGPLRGARMGSVLSADVYHRLLSAHCRRVDLWETVYWQVLAGEDALIEWLKGTTLLPYLRRLAPSASAHFVAAYRERLRDAYPPRWDGCTLFPFRRIFFVAQR